MVQTLRTLYLELIETLWNVNDMEAILKELQKIELIETLWNVNSLSIYFMKLVATELIETLWNVNPWVQACPKGVLPN